MAGLIGNIAESGKAGVDQAVKAASAAFAAHRKTPAHQRIAWLKAAAARLGQCRRGNRRVDLRGRRQADPYGQVRGPNRGAEFLELTAAALTADRRRDVAARYHRCRGRALRLRCDTFPMASSLASRRSMRRSICWCRSSRPRSPQATPSSSSPRLRERAPRCGWPSCFTAAGWPKDLFTVVTGDRETALALAAHPRVRAVSFHRRHRRRRSARTRGGRQKIRRRTRLQCGQHRHGRRRYRDRREKDRGRSV